MKKKYFLKIIFFKAEFKYTKSLMILFCLLSNIVFSQTYNFETYNNTNSGIGFNGVRDIEIDSQGNKWIVSEGGFGISKFDNSNWTLYNTSNQQGTNAIHKVEFSTGVLESWVSVFATTTLHYTNGTQSIVSSDNDYTTNILSVEIPINVVSFQIDYYIEDSSASVNMIFYNLNTSNVVHQETFSGTMTKEYDHVFFTNIMTNYVKDLSIDNLDNKWIATAQNGLIKFDNTNWTNFNTSNSDIPSNNINSIATDTNNNVWIATTQGLAKFDGTSWTIYNTSNSLLTSNNIHSVYVDYSNNVWITLSNLTNVGNNTWTDISKLLKFDGNIWNVYQNTSQLSFSKIFGLYGGEIYLKGGYGFIKFFNNSFIQISDFDDTNCLIDCQVEAIDIDNQNSIWIGYFQECNNAGLQNFTNCTGYFSSNSGLPENNILSLKIDNSNNMWIGTSSSGLVKMSSGLGIEDLYSNNQFFVYPNPTNGLITISNNELNSDNVEYKIIDLSGRIVKTGYAKFNDQIDIGDLTTGKYLIEIKNKEGKRTIQKFIRN